MLDAQGYDLGGQVFAAARAQPPCEAMELACRAATGQPGFLAIGAHAVHAPGARLVDPTDPDALICVCETYDESALQPFGLALSRLEPRAVAPRTVPFDAVTVALRLGLLAQMLDRAFAHLETRQSFGQKLTHHQLIKGRFSETGAVLSRQREELAQDPEQPVAAERLHAEIDSHTVQAAKLMGGHGFRAGALNGLEYVSALLRATLAPMPGARN